MHRDPSIHRPRVAVLLLLGSIAIAGCDTRDPTGAAGRTARPLRGDTYGPPVMLANFEYQANCGTNPLVTRDCVAQPDSLVAVPGPGRHRIKARISGWIRFEGSQGPAPHCASGISAFGIYNPLTFSYFLRTDVYWAFRDRSAIVPLEPVNGDSGVVEGSVDVPEGGAVYIRRGQGGYVSSCHMVSPPPVVEISTQQIFDDAAKLVLTCSPGATVQRGTPITCTASTSPAGAVDSLKISQWTFEGRPRTDGDVASREWNGIMVTGGMIRVQGTVQGTAVADSAQITVTARSWPPMRAASPAHDSLSGDLPATPTPVAPTATRPFGYDLGSLAHSRMQRVSLPFVGLADSVVAGPNTGWSYVKSPLAGPYFSVSISAAFAHTSAWYQQQHYGSPGGPAYLPYCTRPQIDSLRMRAELHEGLRQTPLSPTDMFQPTNNHYRFFKDWIATNDPNNRIYEPLVWNADSLAARVSTSADEYMTQIWAEMVESPQHTANVAAIDLVSVNLVPINCRAR